MLAVKAGRGRYGEFTYKSASLAMSAATAVVGWFMADVPRRRESHQQQRLPRWYIGGGRYRVRRQHVAKFRFVYSGFNEVVLVELRSEALRHSAGA